VVAEKVIGELGFTGGVSKNPRERRKVFIQKFQTQCSSLNPVKWLNSSWEEGRELDVLGGRTFLMHAILENRRA